MNQRTLLSLLPAGIFWILWRTTETWIAIVGGFAASLIVLRYNRGQPVIAVLTLFGIVVVGLSGIVGILWDSPKAYLASGPVSDFIFVPVYLVSIAIHKPLVGAVARELFPTIAGRVPIEHRVFVIWSYAWAAFNLAQGFVRLWLLQELSVGEYLVWSRVVFWPVSTLMFIGSATMIYRESLKHPPRGVPREAEPVPA
jgi:intracellular septation protein A